MAQKDVLGKRGERIAVDHLIANGFEIVDRNWRCDQGEIDIVAKKDDELAFVEVKTRSSLAYGHPFEAITTSKLARLKRLAGAWCSAHPGSHESIRIDAIGIIAPTMGLVEIEHLERVF